MATRATQQNQSRKVGLSGGENRGADGNSWTVFHSMKEFWLWVTIVSLIIACMLALFLLVIYLDKKTSQETRRVEMMIQRLEEAEKAKKKESKDE